MRPGQKVLCLTDTWNRFPPHLNRVNFPTPKKGKEYIVRSTYVDPFISGLAIRLVGLILPVHPSYRLEPGFTVYDNAGNPNFRLIIETDISVFQKLLAPKTTIKELV